MKYKLIACRFLIGFITLTETAIAQNFDSVEIKTNKITESIYFLEGSGGNIGVLTGKDGVILIDDQFAPLTEKIKKALAAISNKPVKFVINTHFHFDHTGGNENFGAEGAVIVAHENNRRRLTTDQFIATFKTDQKAAPYDAIPKVTFTESVTFHLNGETVQAFHVKNAHTDGDVIIQFKESNVFHTGDVFVRYGLPFIDQPNGGSIDGMIDAINQLLALTNEQSIIIPGHGAISGKKDLIDYLKMLQTVRKRIAEGMRKGKTLQQIIDSEPAKEFTAAFERSLFVESVYTSLKK